MNAKPNDNEIVKALRICVECAEDGCPGCPYAPNGCDRMHAEAADLIESMQAQLAASRRRERAAVEDMQLIAGDIGSPLTCAVCKYNPNDMGCELDGSQFNDNCECHFTWRGPQEAEKGEAE